MSAAIYFADIKVSYSAGIWYCAELPLLATIAQAITDTAKADYSEGYGSYTNYMLHVVSVVLRPTAIELPKEMPDGVGQKVF